MRKAAGELRGDLARREIGDLDIVEACDGAAVVAGAAGLRQLEPGAGEEGRLAASPRDRAVMSLLVDQAA